jgi:hypothetical protein
MKIGPRKWGDIPAGAVFRLPVEENMGSMLLALRDRIGAEDLRRYMGDQYPFDSGKGVDNTDRADVEKSGAKLETYRVPRR